MKVSLLRSPFGIPVSNVGALIIPYAIVGFLIIIIA